MTFPVSIRAPGKDIPMRMGFPYGMWTCDDGRQVLFNREYQPIWERSEGASARQAHPNEWVQWRSQAWFYDDFNSPWLSGRAVSRCAKILEAFCEGENINRYIVHSRSIKSTEPAPAQS